jgi:hypothetical protein
MKITPIAAATILPATLAGVVLTAMPLAQAAPVPAHAHSVHHAAATRSVKAAKTAAKPSHIPARHTQAAAQQTAGSTATASPSQAPAQPAPQTQQVTPSQPLTAGMSSFEQCVAWRESGDNPTASSAGLFGILPSTWAELGYSGTAGQASVALQKVAFNRLYAEYGAQPWAPSDGC